MKNIKALFFLVAIAISSSLSAQTSNNGIKWMSIGDAEKASKEHPKKIIIDVYTDWCGWCKRLDATTYTDEKVVKYINDNYYAVKLNAESKDKIVYQGKEYNYDASQRINTVATNFLSQSPGYPTTTFLGENFEVLSVVPGYMKADAMINVLKYFGENNYKTEDWNTYLNSVSNNSKQ
jgi:thioredoxin-related protein